MAPRRRRREAAARLVFAAALTLAGAGAGSGSSARRQRQRVNPGRWGRRGRHRRAVLGRLGRHRQAAPGGHHRRLAERDQVLDPVVSEPAHDLSVLGLLLPTRQSAAPFRGRAADLAWLQAWRDNADGHPAALVTGPGGTGKTRLVTQFAATRPPPWAAGWLHPGRGASALAAVRACGDPALILIDDADASPDAAALLTDLAAQPDGPRGSASLLIARTADALTQARQPAPRAARWIIAPGNLPVRTIGPFGSTDDHARWFGEAIRAYAAARRTPPPDLPALTATGSTTRAAMSRC